MTLEETISVVKGIYPDSIAIKGINNYAIIQISGRTLQEIEKFEHHEMDSNKYEISDWFKSIDDAWFDASWKIQKELLRKLEK